MSDGPLRPQGEARHQLGDISRSHLYQLIRDGELATVKVGSRTMIPQAELDAFVQRHRTHSGAADAGEPAGGAR